jgi:hypothetical protein
MNRPDSKVTKQEFIAAVAYSLISIEATSVKTIAYQYHGFIDAFSFDIAKNKEDYNTFLLREFISFSRVDDLDSLLEEIQQKINDVSKIEDGPVEKMVNIRIPESKAKEMGVA